MECTKSNNTHSVLITSKISARRLVCDFAFVTDWVAPVNSYQIMYSIHVICISFVPGGVLTM